MGNEMYDSLMRQTFEYFNNMFSRHATIVSQYLLIDKSVIGKDSAIVSKQCLNNAFAFRRSVVYSVQFVAI